MEELLEGLEQGIEMRVNQLREEWETRKQEPDPETRKKEAKECADRMDQIMKRMTEMERHFLDSFLMDRSIESSEERIWFYKSGLADALEILRYLRG